MCGNKEGDIYCDSRGSQVVQIQDYSDLTVRDAMCFRRCRATFRRSRYIKFQYRKDARLTHPDMFITFFSFVLDVGF
jgi:hypothetical protein